MSVAVKECVAERLSKERKQRGKTKFEGKAYNTTHLGIVKVIEFVTPDKLVVEVCESGEMLEISARKLKTRVKELDDNLRSTISGVGINDKEFSSNSREYKLWRAMLRRCYKKDDPSFSAYKDCSVEEYFHSFKNFYDYISQLTGVNSVDDSGRSFQLDKDLIVVGNKEYARGKICFIPAEINTFLAGYSVATRIYSKEAPARKFYTVTLGSHYYREEVTFKSKEEAIEVYKREKEIKAKRLAEKWKDCISEEAYIALSTWSVSFT